MSFLFKPAGRTVVALIIVVAAGCTTPGYYVVPSVSIDALYDDNLYFAPEDEESDFITRVSPELEVGYDSATLTWSGRYRSDAEWYSSNSELDSAQVRQFAHLEAEYLPTNRLTLRGIADYTETNTPLDLSLVDVGGGTIPGLVVGRVDAERIAALAAADYQWTATTASTVSVSHTKDDLSSVGENDTNVLEAFIDQQLSARSRLSYGYMHRQYRFSPDQGQTIPRTSEDSNTPWLGLEYEFTPRTTVVARGGVRVNGSTDPYVLLELHQRYANSRLSLGYERDETTLLGVPGRLDVETLSGTLYYELRDRLELQVMPGYARVSRPGFEVDIASLGLGAIYKITEWLFLTASYERTRQKLDLVTGDEPDVSRGVVQVGVRLTYPRREPRSGTPD